MLSHSKTRFHKIRLRLEEHVPSSRFNSFVWEFFLFGFKQAWACLFGGTLLALVLLTKEFWPSHAWLARYDFLFLAALTLQVLMLVLRMETVREAKVILIFHVVGTLMELFKTSVGSWTYPEMNLFRIGHVPLFSGFMYGAVGSYLARISRILDMRYLRYPPRWATLMLAALIYINFFSHHFIPDLRAALFVLTAVIFGRTWVYYKPYRVYRSMPLVVGFMLVALFIWCAENVGTFATIWVYPHQKDAWRPVEPSKYGAWLLLMIISFVLVTLVHPPRAPEDTIATAEIAGKKIPTTETA